MSQDSQAKKARRRKRRDSKQNRWLPDSVMGAVEADVDAMADEILAAADRFGEWITGRGWTFDEDATTDGVVSWFFEPSAVEPDTDEHEAIMNALRDNAFHRGRAAEALGINRSTLWRRMQRLGIEV